MWTPKRVLILLGGMVLFSTLYTIYFHFLGGIDGFPQLPEAWCVSPDGSHLSTPVTPPRGIDVMLEQAFGPGCEELQRPIRLLLRSKGLGIATKKFDLCPDHRVKLTSFSAIIFAKGKAEKGFPEINTVKSEIALLTLDQPATTREQLAKRKITKIELTGAKGIEIRNNRRTSRTSDHLVVNITEGPLFYDDERNLIWTDGVVKLVDNKTIPATTIDARGMELHLVRGKTGGKSEGGVTGVELLVLKSAVDMHLHLEQQSGFLGDAKAPPGKKAKSPHVIIRTNGDLRYDLTRERAHFRSPKTGAAQALADPTTKNRVLVQRVHELDNKETKFDEIYCDDLQLQFRPKNAAQHGGEKKGGGDKEIEWALATASPGKEVFVSMQTENLEATGNEMQYWSADNQTGPKTIIKGQPMHAKNVKDGHRITAPELHLVGNDKSGMGQQAEARGTGQLDMFDKASASEFPQQHAAWRDKLTLTKIREHGRLLDLLVLEGDASFQDDLRAQTLKAQTLKVWLEPAERRAADTAAPATGNKDSMAASGQKLQRLEADRDVSYVSPDVHIVHAERLFVNTQDKPRPPGNLPDALQQTAAPNRTVPAETAPPPMRSDGDDSRVAAQGNTPSPRAEKKKARPPIRLWARDVQVNVWRVGPQQLLKDLLAEHDVHVVQDPETAKDKGVDIQGAMLNLINEELGKILHVYGDATKAGRLAMNDMILEGPKITINQKDNMAEAEGVGSLDMPSNSTLDGKAAKSGARMKIHWNKRMVFNGRTADFFGDVRAVQADSNLKCENLYVTMDREVSFKEGQKGKEAAKVDKILCELKVNVTERVKDERTGVLIREQEGSFSQLTVDNRDAITNAIGPGHVASYSRESSSLMKKENGPAKNAPKVTRVEFFGRLWSLVKDKTRTSKFYGEPGIVEVFHFPATNLHMPFNRVTPPKDGFYLRCSFLEIVSRPVAGKNCQLMTAWKHVTFWTDEISGRADVVKFDEATDIVIFEANPGNTVVITKFLPGGAGQNYRGRKVQYNRRTGALDCDGVQVLDGQSSLAPSEPNRFLGQAANPGLKSWPSRLES